MSQPRTVGSAHISSKQRGVTSCLDDLRLSGACRALFPRPAADALDVVLLNTSGGITGGDRLDIRCHAGTGSALSLTTQAAERVYKTNEARYGVVKAHLSAAESARIDWLPQETILFDHCRLNRSLHIDLVGDAELLMVEPMIFGRTAMGETVHQADLRDQIRLRHNGRMIFADSIRLQGDIQAHLDRPAIANGARAMASLLFVNRDADLMLAPLRGAIGSQGGVSLVRPNVLFARILAEDGFALRTILLPALRLLRGADLPRTWML